VSSTAPGRARAAASRHHEDQEYSPNSSPERIRRASYGELSSAASYEDHRRRALAGPALAVVGAVFRRQGVPGRVGQRLGEPLPGVAVDLAEHQVVLDRALDPERGVQEVVGRQVSGRGGLGPRAAGTAGEDEQQGENRRGDPAREGHGGLLGSLRRSTGSVNVGQGGRGRPEPPRISCGSAYTDPVPGS
jgi:hypothetical protein